jgi:hypothetical protein
MKHGIPSQLVAASFVDGESCRVARIPRIHDLFSQAEFHSLLRGIGAGIVGVQVIRFLAVNPLAVRRPASQSSVSE